VFLAATKPLLMPSPSEAAWKLFALIPWLLFQRVASKPAPKTAALLHARFRLFLSGSWEELIHMATNTEAEWTQLFAQARTGNKDPEAKRLAKVQATLYQGDISRAANLLSSNSAILDPSQDQNVAAKVGQLLIQEPYPVEPTQNSILTSTHQVDQEHPNVALNVTTSDTKKAISHTKPTAAGPSGWHISVLKALATNAACLERITAILNILLTADIPSSCLRLFSSGSLSVLSKDNGGVRPIVTRSTWLRLLSKCVVAREQPALARSLAPLQCGVGMQGGSEFIVHSVRQMLAAHPNWCLITFDATNAYGSVSRAAIRAQLNTATVPKAMTVAYFERFCAPVFPIRHGQNFQVSVAEGVIQGDPISPLLFALALQPALVAAQAALQEQDLQANIFSYLDDICMVAPTEAVATTAQSLESSLAAIKLRLNSAKTQVFSPLTTSDQVPDGIKTLVENLGARLSSPTISILGSVIAGPSASATDCDILSPADDARLFRRLDAIPSLQLRLILLRFSVTRSYLHRLRTSPPCQTLDLARRVDSHIAQSLAQLCGITEGLLPHLTLQEACLPTNMGGLGLTNLENTRQLAYTASLLATIQTWRKHVLDTHPLLQGWASSTDLAQSLTALKPTIQYASSALKCTLIFPDTPEAAVVYTKSNQLQRRLQGFWDLNSLNDIKQQLLVTTSARAQYLSKTGRGARAFLQACPTDNGLRLNNGDMIMALRLWLRLPVLHYFDVPAEVPCFCRLGVSLTEEHLLNCNGSAARDVRHDTLTLCVQEMLQASVQRPVLMEPRASTTTGDHHRFDISVTGFDSSSNDLKLDITVRNPLARHMVARAAVTTLAAANEGVRDKHRTYDAYIGPSDTFLPLAFETFGAMHPNISELITRCARRVSNVAPDTSSYLAPTFATYWTQRLSCTLMRENCRLVNLVIDQSLRHAGVEPGDHNALTYTSAITHGEHLNGGSHQQA
jgi:hypothetical protein